MKVIKLNKEAKEAIRKGIDLAYDCVRLTLGAAGRNAIIGKEFSNPVISNDGIYILREIEVEDEIEQMGVDLMRSVAQKTNETVGDGTTSTVILAKKILDACFSKLDGLVSFNAMELKRKVIKDCEEVIKRLQALAKEVKSREDIYNIAFTSVENEDLANMVADIFEKIGKDGFAAYKDSSDSRTTYEINNGYEMGYGCASPQMELKIKDAYIYIFNRLVNDLGFLRVFTNSLAAKGINEMAVFARDFSDNVISELNLNILNNNFKVLCVRCGEEEMKDISALTGASIIIGDNDQVVPGNAGLVSADKNKTFISGGVGDVSLRVAELREKETSSEFEKEFIKKKISQLTGGVGVIKIGATTDEEKEYLKLKIEDAIHSVPSALNTGYLPGGGQALLKVSDELNEDNILKKPIRSVYEQVLENGVKEIPDNVIDSFGVVKTSLENACSLASVVLTGEAAIAEKRNYERI